MCNLLRKIYLFIVILATGKKDNKIKKFYKNSKNITSIGAGHILELTTQTQQLKKIININAKKIVKKNLKTPEKLLEYIQDNGTNVYKISNADKFLQLINEDEGLITELSGLKAFYINFITKFLSEKKLYFSFKSQPMFILRPEKVDIYYMSHQFHKWYSLKSDLPGYDEKTQQIFKQTLKKLDIKDAKFSLGEVISLKEAINRDKEAIDFVINLAKEEDGSRNCLKKMLSDKGANV